MIDKIFEIIVAITVGCLAFIIGVALYEIVALQSFTGVIP